LFFLSFILFSFFSFFFSTSLFIFISVHHFHHFLWNTFALLQTTNNAWQDAMEHTHTHTHRHLPFDLQVSRTMGYLLPTSTRLFPGNENLCVCLCLNCLMPYLVGFKWARGGTSVRARNQDI
jgi:hypothetical protein